MLFLSTVAASIGQVNSLPPAQPVIQAALIAGGRPRAASFVILLAELLMAFPL